MRTIALIMMSFALNAVNNIQAQTLPMLSEDSVVKIATTLPDSGTVVVNFWATWCGPCVHELPFFVQADSQLRDESYTFVFISFDPGSKKAQVQKFIRKKGLPGIHYMIGNFDLGPFIDKIDPKWEGDIPYTIVLTPEGRRNHTGSFETFRDLWQFIREF